MKQAKSAAVKRPAAADDHPGSGALKRPAKTSGTLSFPRLPGHDAYEVDQHCPLSGEIPYYDSTSGEGLIKRTPKESSLAMGSSW